MPGLLGTREAVRQVADGNDFESPALMLGDLSPELATRRLEGWPYSIADNVAHMLYWQMRWLARIDGRPLERSTKEGDWPRVKPAQWESVRAELLAGIEAARAKCGDAADLARPIKQGGTVELRLLKLAIHNAYHLGQIALMRQLLGSWPPAGGSDTW